MRVDRINYQKLFPIGIYQNIRVGVEAQLESGDDADESFNKLKTFVEDWFTKNYPHVGESVTYATNGVAEKVVENVPRDRRIQIMINDMQTVTDLKTLETYEFLSRKYPEIHDAYEKKLKELEESS